MQVPADQVIAILTQELGDMHRENAILKVQVGMLNNQLTEAQAATVQPTSTALPPVPSITSASSSPLYDATTSSLATQSTDVTPAPDLSA